MIEKLTKEQEELQAVIRNKWINLALNSGDEINESEAKKGIEWLYELSDLKKPEFIVVDSPLGIQYLFKALEIILDKKQNSVWNSVENSVRNSVENSVGNSVENSVGNSVWNSVENSVRNSVGNSVGNSVRNSVGNSVENSVWNSVGNSVENSVWNSVRNSVGKYYEFSWCNLSNVGWIAFYDYFKNLEIYKKDTQEIFDKYIKYLESGIFFTSFYENFAVVSRRPQKVRKNNQGFLHSDEFPAIEWRDGYKLFFLNGVEFKQELWEKVISRKMSLKEVMEIVDTEQRTQAMKYVNVEEFIEQFKGETLSTYQKLDINGDVVNYKLIMIPANKNLFTIDSYHAIYDCPSTKKIYMSGIDPEIGKKGDIKECMAWKGKMSIKDWELLVPLQTES